MTPFERPARWAAATLVAGAAVLAAGFGLDKAQLPGWAFAGGAVAATLYLALRTPSKDYATALGAWCRRLVARHPHLRRLLHGLGHVLEPIGTLARIVLPLAVLPLVIVLFAARGLRVYKEALVGFAAVAIVVPTLHVEWLTIRRTLAWVGTRNRKQVIVAVAVLAYSAPTLTLLWLRPHGVLPGLERIGGTVTTVALVGVVLWFVAVVLRVVAFAASPWRLLGLLAIGVSAARAAMLGGLVEGERWAERRIDARLPGGRWFWLALFAVGLLTVIAANPFHRKTRQVTWGRVAAVFESAGFVGCLAAATVFFVALVLAGHPPPSGKPVSAVTPTLHRTASTIRVPSSDATLARMFSPILELHHEEQWPLLAVRTYLESATLWGERAHGRSVTIDTLPASCPPGARKPCYVLRCVGRAASCVPGSPVGYGKATRAAVYAHVVRYGRDADIAAFVPRVTIGRKLLVSTMVEYWFFYAYDRWQAPTAAGLLTQQHKADWEAVVVGLADDRPLFVAYSAHCGGTWTGWAKAEKRGLHPVVAVALGSHANYANTAASRASDWGSCEHVPSRTTAALSYTWNVRDRTSADFEVTPAKVIVVRNGDRRTGFAGRWGLTDRTVLQNQRRFKLAGGPGPKSPALQDLWSIPSWRIFKTAEWRRAG
jgi:hypothetical protein